MNYSKGLMTISGIIHKYGNLSYYKEMSESALRRRFNKSRDKLFGCITEKGSKKSEPGLIGTREYVWAIKQGDYNQYRFMTDVEEEILNEFIKAAYSELTIEQIKNLSLLEQVLKENEITVEEYFERKAAQKLDFFNDVILKFKEITGLQLVCANYYIV